MPRPRRVDASIGERIRTRRQLRGWSVRHAADRAGISHTTLSRIERGILACDNRFVVADIAAALECSVAELVGAPGLAVNTSAAELQAGGNAVRAALVEYDLAEPPIRDPRPFPEIAAEVDLVRHLRYRCDDAGTARLMPRLLRDLHGSARGPNRTEALRLLVQVAAMSSGVFRYVSTPAEMFLASERSRQAAEALDEPVFLALAEYERALAAIACGSYRRGLTLASRAADELVPQVGPPLSAEVYGMLLLACAFASLGDKRRDDSAGWLAQAQQLAQRTGETTDLGLHFGPTNINIWRISMEADGGDPGRAVEIANTTTPTRLPSKPRQMAFYADTGRCLARLGRDSDALRMLLAAERTAPHRLHSSVLVRETARTMLDRSGQLPALRGLCERMGVPR